MSARVAPDGETVLDPEIRARLGIEPGWQVFQQFVDDHVELRFPPPEHSESLAGILAPYTSVSIPEDAYHEARDLAWEAHVRERYGNETA